MLAQALAVLIAWVAATNFQAAEPFDEWFCEVWRLAAQRTTDDGLYVRWTEADVYVPATAELDALRAAVDGHPQHPDRESLARYRAILAGKPPTVENRLWIRGDEWRLSWDFPDKPGSWFDRALASDRAWGMGPEQLARLDPRRGLPAGYEYNTETPAYRADALVFQTGGLSLVPLQDVPCPQADMAGGRWEARAELPRRSGTGTLIVRGGWRATDARGWLDEVIYTNARGSATTYLSEQWAERAPGGRWAAGRISVSCEAQSHRRLLTLVELGEVSVEEIGRLTATPATDGSDPIRGAASFRSVRDFTGSVPRSVPAVTLENGERTEGPARVLPGYQSTARLRAWGWVLAGMIAATLVMLRFRKRGLRI